MRRLLLVDPAGRVSLSGLEAEPDPATPARAGAPTPSGAAGQGAQVRTAVWSTAGGWAAYAVDSVDLDGPRELRVLPADGSPERVLASSLTAFYLCPSPCGRWLSHLSPGPLGLELAVSEVATGELRVIERGQPLYWAWSPDSARLAVHLADQLSVVDLATGEAQMLTADADGFLAPWWTPDGSVVAAVDGRLVSFGLDGSRAELAPSATGRFALDGDGRRLALVQVGDEGPGVAVFDLLTGERHQVTGERTGGFFWSPDGTRLAVLVVAGASQLQWLVFDGDRSVRLPPFQPSGVWLRDVLPFFEQYSQSHATWSADGTRLVAPGLADGDPRAVVQTVDAPLRTDHVAGGSLAWWAPEPNPA